MRPNPGGVMPAEEFWSRVNKTDTCWLWTGKTNYHPTHPYGLIYIYKSDGKRTTRRAHRIAYELINGAIPDGLYACHACDTTLCVRPDHLFLGTQKENLADCIAKDRFHPERRGKLTRPEVEQIRQMFPDKSYNELAEEFGVTRSNISYIIREKTWK